MTKTPAQFPNRRAFLKTASATALISAPNLLLAQKTAPKKVVIGSGEHQFECHHFWGQLPEDHNYGGATHGTAIDADGLIYIAHTGKPGSIYVFDADGKFIKSLAPQFEGRGHGIDIRKEGKTEFLYLSPADHTSGFAKMTMEGELVWQKDKSTIAADTGLYESDKARFRSTNLNFAPDGGYFLGDGYGSGYIHRYGADDKYISSFGGGGTEDGKFRTPHGQWLDERDGTPKVVVCDRANARLQWFDLNGKHLKTLGGFLFPADIDIQGDIMLVPDLHTRITLLDKENKVIAQLGEDEEWRQTVLGSKGFRNKKDQWKDGKFIHPHDAVFDADGNIFCAEWVSGGRVTKLKKVS